MSQEQTMHLYCRYKMCERDVFRCEAGSVQCLPAHFISQVFGGAVYIIDVILSRL